MHQPEHDIDVGDAQPLRQRAYHLPIGMRRWMEKREGNTSEHEIAEPASSSWASMSVKADGSDTFGTDFRKINAVTKPALIRWQVQNL